MKKILIMAIAAISFAACIQEAVIETPQGDAIAFQNPFVDNATRAEALTESNLEAFQVWGYVNQYSGILFTAENVIKNQETGLWNYEHTQYWVPGNKYHFAAVAPVTLTPNWTLSMETSGENPERMLTFTNSENADTDLIYAAATVESTSENNEVAFQFKHMLSNVKFSFATESFPANNDVTIYDIQISTPKQGTIDLLSDAGWSISDDIVTIKPVLDENQSSDNYFILPAQCNISFKIKIEINDVVIYDTEQPKTSSIPASAFEMGHAYNLIAEISPETLNFEELMFVVEGIDVWEAEGNDSDRAANLIYTAQIGGTYDLTEDLDVNTTVTVSKDLVINLNGNTLKYKGDNRLFKVTDGAVLTINGETEGSAVAVHSDNLTTSTTAAYIATAYEGSKIIINGGDHTTNGCTLYHANGGTVEINDGTFAATETGYDPAGKYGYKYTLNVQGGSNGTIIVRGGSFKNYDPSNSKGENPVANFLADGYAALLDGEWYKVIQVVFVNVNVDPAKQIKDAIKAAQEDAAQGEPVEVNILLNTDITPELTIDVPAGVELNLNLNEQIITIDPEVMTPNSNGSHYAFIVREGATLVIDGDGSVESTTPAPIFFYPAGNLVIESGTFIRHIPEGYSGSVGSMFVGTKPAGGWHSAGVTINGGYFDGGYYDPVAAQVEAILSGEAELVEEEQDIAKRGQPGDANVTRKSIKSFISATFNKSNNYFKVYGGTFVGANPAWGDEGCMLPTSPYYLRPWSYYQGGFIEGQEFNADGIVLPEGYAITKGTHEDGRPTYTVTYNK